METAFALRSLQMCEPQHGTERKENVTLNEPIAMLHHAKSPLSAAREKTVARCALHSPDAEVETKAQYIGRCGGGGGGSHPNISGV